MRERTTAEMMVLDLLAGADGSGVRSCHRISVRTAQETMCTFFVIIPYIDTDPSGPTSFCSVKTNESTGSSADSYSKLIGGYSISKSCLLDLMITTFPTAISVVLYCRTPSTFIA